jgi:hypothetical protein
MNGMAWREKWSNSQIQSIAQEQFDAFWNRPIGIERSQLSSVSKASASPHTVIVSGLRRVGKSTLLRQFANQLGKDNFYYFNFDDDRMLGFLSDDTETLFSALVEVFGERRNFILDEVQNVQEWERFVRRWMDQGYKLYITGSNASLLSRELGTRLTGRYIPIELFPFSFKEYLAWREDAPSSNSLRSIVSAKRRTTVQKAQLNRELSRYLNEGGMPEALRFPELQLLRTLYDDVIYRDIATRHRINDARAIRELSHLLMSNPAGLVTFSKLKQLLGLGSVTTINNYVQYLEDSWLILTANRYDRSVKRQLIAPKKVYGIDTGLINAVGFQPSQNSGHLLETLVFLELRRATRQLYYYLTKSGFEIDVYLPDRKLFVQVAQYVNNPDVYAREMRALNEAVAEIDGSQGLLLTLDSEFRNARNVSSSIQTRSVTDWLLRASDETV